MRPSQQHRPDVVAEREAFRQLPPLLNASRLVFVDERWHPAGHAAAYGYAF